MRNNESELVTYRLYSDHKWETLQAPASSEVHPRTSDGFSCLVRESPLRTDLDWQDRRHRNHTNKPILLDLFAGAGGASRGYQRAGFYVVGVDIKLQPHYCGDEFYQADALTFPLEGYDAYHASPPCQWYSRLRHLPWLKNRIYWRSIPPTKARLETVSAPWVIENVEDALIDLPDSIILCGQMFNLPIFRHRRFQTHPFLTLQPPHEKHHGICAPGGASMAKRYAKGNVAVKEINRDGPYGQFAGVDRVRRAMGIDWMNQGELAQAIPPCYTCFIGGYLLSAVLGGGHQPFGSVPERKCDICDGRRQDSRTQHKSDLGDNGSCVHSDQPVCEATDGNSHQWAQRLDVLGSHSEG